MKKILRLISALMLIIIIVFNTVSCDIISGLVGNGNDPGGQESGSESFYIDGPANINLEIGESKQLDLVIGSALEGDVIWTSSSKSVSVVDGLITAISEGKAVIKAALGDKLDRVVVNVLSDEPAIEDPEKPIVPDTPDKPEDSDIENDINDGHGETIIVPGTEDPVTSDPYVGVDKDDFYASYTPAVSYMDAYYRTQHGLMSGSIEEQDQAPTISAYQPSYKGSLIRNDVYLFSEDGNTYYVVDCYGEISFEIYKGGAYVVLEEVAAYVFAFGEPPANHSDSKKTKPTQSEWGEYLRVNNTNFSGDTGKYPYEPELPRISGCGGDLTYYEMDIGTTGTDCDPSFDVKVYNDGYSITRGAARIVYSCKDKNGNKIIDLDERYVFYTYNHYNDFQEYLNYEGGWGEMFGNVTGGGTLSDKSDCNPTPYVGTVRCGIYKDATVAVYCILPTKKFAA